MKSYRVILHVTLDVEARAEDRARSKVDRILSPENFASTVYRKLGIDPGKLLYSANGRPAHIVSEESGVHHQEGRARPVVEIDHHIHPF